MANLLFTLKTQFSNHMTKYFKQIIDEENLLELFTKKNALNEEISKYVLFIFYMHIFVNYHELFLFKENILMIMILWN